MADDPEHGLDAATLARLEAIVQGLQDDYLAKSAQEVARLEAACDAAGALPPEERGPAMRLVFAVSHDIKGSGGSFHYDLMSEIGHALCRFVEARSVFAEADLEIVRRHVAAMRTVVEQRLSGDGGAAGRALLAALAAGPVTD